MQEKGSSLNQGGGEVQKQIPLNLEAGVMEFACRFDPMSKNRWKIPFKVKST